jgi:hypothetical protein
VEKRGGRWIDSHPINPFIGNPLLFSCTNLQTSRAFRLQIAAPDEPLQLTFAFMWTGPDDLIRELFIAIRDPESLLATLANCYQAWLNAGVDEDELHDMLGPLECVR